MRVSALIVREDQVVLVEFFTEQKGVHYDLPGGGLDPSESLRAGVQRECREEIGCEVSVGRLLMLAEYIPSPSGGMHSDRHTIDFVFEAFLVDGQEPHLPALPDEDQTGAKWMPIATLSRAYLRPAVADWLVSRARLSQEDVLFEDAWL